MDSWCVKDVTGNVTVVIRSGARDSVRIIRWHYDLPDSDFLQGNIVVITRRRIVSLSTLCVYNRYCKRLCRLRNRCMLCRLLYIVLESYIVDVILSSCCFLFYYFGLQRYNAVL